MSYGGFDDKTSDAGSKGTFPVGIIENVELKSVAYSKEQWETLEYVFVDSDGMELKHKEFPVREGVEWADKAKDALNKRTVHILRRFLPEDKAIIPAVSSFEGFAKAVVKLLGNSYKGKKLRLKTVYNTKGFVSLPSWPVFIENMEVAVADSKIAITANDRMTRPTPTKVGNKSGYGGTETPVEASAPTDDLPF